MCVCGIFDHTKTKFICTYLQKMNEIRKKKVYKKTESGHKEC